MLKLLACALAGTVSFVVAQPATQQTLQYVGGDISMLPSLERFGAVYRDADGKPDDAIAIFRSHGWNLFRVRLFVNPSVDYDKSWGATQSLDEVIALCKRVKAAGGDVLLDLHYSDTWADPDHQAKPAAWKDLPFDQLEKRVHDYTADVLETLKRDGVTPKMVQIGNEITAGMLWPDGAIYTVPPADRPAQWKKLQRLINAGASAVREADSPDAPIAVLIHAHGGGKLNLAKDFFANVPLADFDYVGVSFYPRFGESLDHLERQITELKRTTGRDVLIVEAAYPQRDVDVKEEFRAGLRWPFTPKGQATFASDLRATATKAGAIGICWWYPEAAPVKDHAVYLGGAEGLFDEQGRAQPALDALAK